MIKNTTQTSLMITLFAHLFISVSFCLAFFFSKHQLFFFFYISSTVVNNVLLELYLLMTNTSYTSFTRTYAYLQGMFKLSQNCKHSEAEI